LTTNQHELREEFFTTNHTNRERTKKAAIYYIYDRGRKRGIRGSCPKAELEISRKDNEQKPLNPYCFRLTIILVFHAHLSSFELVRVVRGRILPSWFVWFVVRILREIFIYFLIEKLQDNGNGRKPLHRLRMREFLFCL